MSLFARVVFPLPLTQSFLYAVPAPLAGKVRPGTRVLVPLGRKRQKGFVVGVSADPPQPDLRTKDILEVLDAEPFWDPRFLSFTEDLAAEFYSSWGEILQAALPPSLTLKTRTVISLTEAGRAARETGALKPRERAVADLLASAAKGRSPRYLERKTGIRTLNSLAARMAAKGLVEIASGAARLRTPLKAGPPDRTVQLGLDFAPGPTAGGPLDPLTRAMDSRRFAAFLLTGERGVLREAYGSLVRRALGSTGKVLVLVPEVARVERAVAGLTEGLGRRAAVFHGSLTEKQREDAWRAVRTGRASFIAGTRSALFLDPGPLSLIIVDDEHDESHGQSESPAYDARRGAWLRACSENGVVVFGSPRPSIEARFEAGRRGLLVDLGGPAETLRASVVESPRDGRLVGGGLEAGIKAALGRRVPVLLFLNRRGYAASLVCAKCGRAPRCRRCDVPMVFHKSEGRLVCHSCNAKDRPACAACGGQLQVRRGAGTQALEEEVKALFPGVPVARFDTDAAGSAGAREAIIGDYARGRLPILIGTQFLAHRPEASGAGFVGILSPEAVLGLPDYRASQRTFQDVSVMMECAAGGGAGEVMIQTALPAHFSIQAAAAGDPLAFYARELEFRRVMNNPPVTSTAEVTLQGRDVRALGARSREFRALLKDYEPEVEVLGPAFASIVRVKDVSRIQVILKSARRASIDRALRGSLPRVRLKATVSISYSPFGSEPQSPGGPEGG